MIEAVYRFVGVKLFDQFSCGFSFADTLISRRASCSSMMLFSVNILLRRSSIFFKKKESDQSVISRVTKT